MNGTLIRDEHGDPRLYATAAEARHVARNWNAYRAPSFAELKAMSDAELTNRATT